MRLIKRDSFPVTLITIIVFIACAWHIPQRTAIYLTGDEFSQYGIAAYLYGFDWRGAFHIGYYQFGFALLFIYPFFLIFGDNIQAVYQCSLVVNALIASSIVPLSYYILKQWGMSSLIENKIYIPVILMVALAGCTIAYSNLGLAEVLMIAIGFALTALVLKMQNTGATHRIVFLFAFLSVFGYACHMRFIGVLASGVIVFIVMVLTKRIKYIYLISFFLTLFTGIILSEFLKHYFQVNVWQINDIGILGSGDGNDITARTSSAMNVLTFNGFKAFVRVLLGQLWYLGIASFLFVYVGLCYLAKKFFIDSISLIRKKSGIDVDYSAVFILFGFLSTMIISGLGTYIFGDGNQNLIRADGLIYGRYNTLMFLPVSLYAAKIIVEKKKDFSRNSIILYLIIIVLFIVQSSYISLFFGHHYSLNQVMVFNVINFINFNSIVGNSTAAIFGFILVCIGSLIKEKDYILSAVLLVIVFFNIKAGFSFLSDHVIPANKQYIEFNDLKEFRDLEEAYFIPNDSFLSVKIQMALPRTRVSSLYDINQLPDFNGTTLFIPTIYTDDIPFSNVLVFDDYETTENLAIIHRYSR